jgi:hypothetical protein
MTEHHGTMTEYHGVHHDRTPWRAPTGLSEATNAPRRVLDVEGSAKRNT